MKTKTVLTIALSCIATALAAENTVTFYDYIVEDGSGIEKLEKIQEENADKKKVYTTHDIVNDYGEKVKHISVLLNEAVMRKVRKLPTDQGLIVLKSHQQWWKYFDATPSLPNINGSASGIYVLATDFIRIKSRWEAVKQPYSQYLTYAKIANLCQVRLDCGTYKMRFGEVCVKKEASWAYDEEEVKVHGKYYHDFATSIIPESCLRDENNFAAVLHAVKGLYLCIWDKNGDPVAVHFLKDISEIDSTKLDAGKVKITGTDKQKKQQTFIFDLNEKNQTGIPSGED